ncbi:uncharacterized protein LOC141647665 [Silene latifolia]|uniref:uncharacterized protein LOC141647665 n=1 Tax=Silene latifolia TaxID=37657 RepID=UPI003D78344D
MGQSPVRQIIRFSRQQLIDGGFSTLKFGQRSFLETLNSSSTPKNSLNRLMINGLSLSTNNRWHKSGRVWIIWNPVMYKVEFLEYSSQCIHMKVTDLTIHFSFHLSMVYAFNDINERAALWTQLLNLVGNNQGAWVVCGDFNCVLSPAERLGGHTSIVEMDEFHNCVNGCGLVESPVMGSYFTWNNKQEAPTIVYTWMDRVLINSEWVDQSDICQGTKIFQVITKLKKLKQHLKEFNRDHFSNIEHATMLALKNQKAKTDWIRTGDANSKFFHGAIKSRHIQNQVIQIKERYGKQCTDPKDVQHSFLDYYTRLIGTEISTAHVNERLVRTGKICESSHWDILAKPITKEEIKNIVFSIPDNKAPVPDGFSIKFYKDSWCIISDEISEAIMDIFTKGKMLKQLNTTVLPLIPKYNLLSNVTQFRRIACCNVLYKILSKLFSARLGNVLPDLVSLNQGGFI